MPAAAARKPAKPKLTKPRLAPPVPARSLIAEYRAAAAELGIELMPWQDFAARFLTGLRSAKPMLWLFREVCIVVARQNGKTTLLKPLILLMLRLGLRILHTAQNRTLPREVFLDLAAALADDDGVEYIRQANGQETIKMKNGGEYTLVAPRPGVRGHAKDIIIMDEVREQQNFELMQAIKPTITASRNPLVIYLSNAGDVSSVVLNDLRRRADIDEDLAYLEWSASPERAIDDLIGWKEANPALGITIQIETLRSLFKSSKPTAFETEHLCRWVRTMRPQIVSEAAWDASRVDDLTMGLRPSMGIAVATDSKRASVALAWAQDDGTFALDIVEDIADDLDLDALGKALRERARTAGVRQIAYATWTDTPLARHLEPKSKPVDGKEFANACVNFSRLVESGFVRWRGSDTISNDMTWLARKAHESGAWTATPVDDEHSVTAALAAIRALWLASAPRPPAPRIG
jgi:hypothetical protein